MNIIRASITGFKNVECSVDNINAFNLTQFYFKNRDRYINIISRYSNNNIIILVLSEEIDIKYACTLYYDEHIFVICDYFKLFASEQFNGRFFTLDELGLNYNETYSEFRVWSPIAISVSLLLYENGNATDLTTTPTKVPMSEINGLWSVRIDKNLSGRFYTYEINVYGNINEATDPYAKAVGVNGVRGAIIDLLETNPIGFENDVPINRKNYTDAVIYELSVRDISTNPNSGVKNPGKFLGLTEKATKTINNKPTGLTYLKYLGITHIQIMPVFDFSYKSVDEEKPYKYNWGYDPQNYNVPEGSYSTNAYVPNTRILELKKMILAFHKSGICVNMDVVYNHVFDANHHCFELIFPGYYFRHNDDGSLSNGSNCGNDTASENLMMKRFIIDSVLYWALEYHLDGFRIDLMGIHDIDTINTLRDKLNKLDRQIMLYGEGWNLSTALTNDKKAIIANSAKLPEIGFFNDIMRDILEGSIFSKYDKGFISGKEGLESGIMSSVVGCTKYSDEINGPFYSPIQSINYISSHDNSTLWDKLKSTCSDEPDEKLIERLKFGLGILLTCQGIPLLSSGIEFGISKEGVENSYNSPDDINWVDWERRDNNINVVTYVKSFIELRKTHPAFRLSTLDDIKDNIKFLFVPSKNTVAFVIKSLDIIDSWHNIVVIYNANKYSVEVKLPPGTWHLVANKTYVSNKNISSHNGLFFAESLSVNVLYNNY